MDKIAIKVPFVHGTSGKWPVLTPGVGTAIAARDPNPRAIYTAINNRRTAPSIENFAQSAAKARGGAPVVASGKMDTQKGWQPRQLNLQGQKTIGSIEDAHALVQELDAGAAEPRRGQIWKLLQQGTGAWHNTNPEASLKPTGYRSIKSAYDRGMLAALLLFGL